MSEVMLQGILRMPVDLWHDDPVSISQRHSAYVQAANELEAKDKEIAELRNKVDMSIDLIDTFSGTPDSSDDLNALINYVNQALKQNER